METTLRKLKETLGLNENTKKESTIVKKAQSFTGLETNGTKTLLRKVRSKKLAQIKAIQIENAKRHNLSRVEYLNLQNKAEKLLSDFGTGYSMGDHKSLFLNGKFFTGIDHTEEYARSCKFRPTHGSINIHLNKKQLRNIDRIEGVWTIVGKDNKVEWLEEFGSKGSYQVELIKGYLVGSSHGKTLREAQVLEAKKNKVSNKVFSDNDFISVDNIRDLGACEAGINSFCREHDLNKEHGYQLGYLKSLNGVGTFYFNKLSK